MRDFKNERDSYGTSKFADPLDPILNPHRTQPGSGDGNVCICWNPVGGNGRPEHHFNPLDFIHTDSPTFVSDVKMMVEKMIVVTSSPDARL